MKRVLITGKNSYIGNQFEMWINTMKIQYEICKISVRNDDWRTQDWTSFDAILHVAGIAHNSDNSGMEDLYYKVNRDLTTEIAKKAKKDGVPLFVNMSSIIVFGTKKEEINIKSKLQPDNFYGESKMQAENNLNLLVDKTFSVANIRPPMVYGLNSKGNFPLLVKIAKKTVVFPKYNNKRSMIYIKNLTEFLRLVIENNISGDLHPQNSDYVSTSTLVKLISLEFGHHISEIKFVNPLIRWAIKYTIPNKVFGNLYYTQDMDDGNVRYQIFSLEESIKDMFRN